MESDDLTLVQFSYERVFKVCYKCECIGYVQPHCLYSFDHAGAIILERLQEEQQFPHSSFWMQDDTPIFTPDLRAFTNTNLNRITHIEILWSELEIGAIETVNAMGLRIVSFLRQNLFPTSNEDDPSEPSELEEMNDVTSNHSNTEPLSPETPPPETETHAVDMTDLNLESTTCIPHHFGLDDVFELELNQMGLSSVIDRPIRVRKGSEHLFAAGPS